MKFSAFAKSLANLEEVASRNEMTVIVSDLLKEIRQNSSEDELISSLYLLNGRVAPSYDSLEFNFASKSIIKLIKELAEVENLTGANLTTFKYDVVQKSKELGDVGKLIIDFLDYTNKKGIKLVRNDDLVEQVEQVQHSIPTINSESSVLECFNYLKMIAEIEGEGAQLQKSIWLKKLIINLQDHPESLKFLLRIIIGKLRLGLSSKTLLDSISWACNGDKSMRNLLDRAYGVQSDLGRIAVISLFHDNPEVELADLELEPGVAVAAQLVERENSAESILQRHEKVIVQPKYDGLRAQVHLLENGEIKIFSRNQESLTHMFPELTELAPIFIENEIKSAVLDGEIIGFNDSTGNFLPFQETIKRKRKYGVDELMKQIPIKFFCFDLLYINANDITTKPLEKRLDILRTVFSEALLEKLNDLVRLTESPVFENGKDLNKYFLNIVDSGLEGVIAKLPQSHYSPGKRSYDWIKLKPNTHAELQDSVDVVVMGYYTGKGSRAVRGIGGFLVGIYNEKDNSYQSLAKVGSGVKDNEWHEYKELLDGYRVLDLPDNYQIKSDLIPDVIVNPEVVIEVDADEVTLSSNHFAGRGALGDIKNIPESIKIDEIGFSLRFPRLKRLREDKSAQNTTSIDELKTLYKLFIDKLN